MKDLETMLNELSAYIKPETLSEALELVKTEIEERDTERKSLAEANAAIRADYTKRFLGTGRTDAQTVSRPNGSLVTDFSDIAINTADTGTGFDEIAEEKEDEPVSLEDILVIKED